MKNTKIKQVSALMQIFLMISLTFALSVIMSDGFVSAEPLSPAALYGTHGAATRSTLSLPAQAGSSTAAAVQQSIDAGLVSNPNIAVAPASEPFTLKGFAKNLYGGKGFGLSGPSGALVAGVAWAVTAYMAVQLIGGLLGLDPGAQKALSNAALGGFFVGGTLHALAGNSALGLSTTAHTTGIANFLSSGTGQFVTGLGVAAVIFILTYSSTTKKLVNFECMPFEPQIGGAKCEQCNGDPLRPCSEYRCKSLGQACQLLNSGTKDEMCAWVGRNDVSSPKITPWTTALYPNNLKYVPDTAVRPPAIGTKVVTSSGGCLPAFTPLEFGIITDEPAQCKIDYNHTAKMDEMQFYFGDSNYFAYNHTQKMRLPGPDSENSSAAPLLQNNGNYALYVRCKDANGNENVDEYSFAFCVDKGPDTTPPIIENFSIPSGSYVTHNQDKIPIEVYINEPAECKWSKESKAYEDMENPMTCFTQGYQVNANLQYTCAGNLTGVANMADNSFFFRCKDQPSKPDNERNTMVQSSELVLKGSQPLNIFSILPNATESITGSTDVVDVNLEVETDDGAESGKAICYFKSNETNNEYVAMFETNNFMHKQILSLTNGRYEYTIRCIDAGGNAAENVTKFDVIVDKSAPKITRAYKEFEALKIVTDEDAQCSYSQSNCNFNISQGTMLQYSSLDVKNNLYAEWKATRTYYIKCMDDYGNQPSPNECGIIVSPIDIVNKTN